MRFILYIAIMVSLVTYLGCDYLPVGMFYIGNSVFILLLCVYLFLNDRDSTTKFVLISLSLNNFLDEVFFDNTKLQITEILVGVTILIFALIKRNARQIRRNNEKFN